MNTDNISEHVSYKEATQSQEAIRKGIDNTPSPMQLAAMKLLATKIIEPARTWYAKPIVISSFFRCYTLNASIGGAKGSQHELGEAVDLDTDSDNAKLFEYIKEHLPFDQLIWEFGDKNNPSWVHVSYGSRNRREVLRAVKVNGVTVYQKF